MITKYTDQIIAKEKELRKALMALETPDYRDIFTIGVKALEDDFEDPDPARIHEIDDGDYQGTLLFVVAARGYQPSRYWATTVDYGSCSGCDTLEQLEFDYGGESKERENGLWQLLLNMFQGMKQISGYGME